jgi:hypothetical protein
MFTGREFIPSLPPRHQLGLPLEVHSAISFMEASMISKTTDRVEDNGSDLDRVAMTAEQPMGVPPGALDTSVNAATSAADQADDREEADDQPDDEDESEDEEEGEEAKVDSSAS